MYALQGSKSSEWWLKRDRQPPVARPAVSGSPCDCELHFCPAPAATSAALGKADFELRLYRHRDRRRDSPRRKVALLFQCSFPLGIPSSPSVKLSENSRRSRSNLSTPLPKLRGAVASRSCRRKETLKKLHYWATDSTPLMLIHHLEAQNDTSTHRWCCVRWHGGKFTTVPSL